MIKNYKTTIVGYVLAVLMAVQPILDGSGYHLNTETIGKLIFATVIAVFGHLTKDHDVK